MDFWFFIWILQQRVCSEYLHDISVLDKQVRHYKEKKDLCLIVVNTNDIYQFTVLLPLTTHLLIKKKTLIVSLNVVESIKVEYFSSLSSSCLTLFPIKKKIVDRFGSFGI